MRGPAFEFRPLGESDLALLAAWRSRPHVSAWWPDTDSLDDLRAEYLDPDTRAGTRGFIAYADGRPVGFVQSYVVRGAGGAWWPDETDPGARGIDQFLAHAEDLGRGLGSAMVRAFVARLFSDPAVTKVQTDPSPDNARAIRSYEKAGFQRVGVVGTPDGPAVLMVVTQQGPDRKTP